MVRKTEVGSSDVDIEFRTEILDRHRRALDVPPRPPRAPTAVPLELAAGLGGLIVVCMFGSRITSFEIFGYFWILAAIVVRANALERAERAARAGAKPSPVPWVAGIPART